MSDPLADEIGARVEAVRGRIARAAARAGRSVDSVTLVGASKHQPTERIAAAVRAGITHLGENFVQELRDKRPALESALEPAEQAALRWHMIGRLQRNKAALALRLFDVIETVDRPALARELDKRAAQEPRSEPLEVLLQVNLSREPQKAGSAPEDVAGLLAACASLPRLRVTGLMTIPAVSDDPERSRPAFAQLRELRDTLRGKPGGEQLRELSMGMSNDFEVAIEEGATSVRVGTAVFGPRPAPAAEEG